MKITDIILSNIGLKKLEKMPQPDYSITGSKTTTPFILTNFYQAVQLVTNWTAVCINKRAKGCSKIPLLVRDVKSKNLLPLHPVQKLLNNPNPLQNKRNFNDLYSKWRDINGNVIIKVEWFGKDPSNLWILPSERVTILPRENNLQINGGYRFQKEDTIEIIPPENIIHIKTIYPSIYYRQNFILGQPYLLQQAASVITADKSYAEFIARYFQFDAIPPFVFKNVRADGKDINKEQLDLFKKAFNETFPNYRATSVIPNGLDFQSLVEVQEIKNALGTNPSEELKIRVCGIFEVPVGVIDSTSLQNKSNSDAIRTDFINDTVEPIIEDLEDSLTQYFQLYYPNIEIFHEPIKYIDSEKQANKNVAYVNAGIFTRDEIREEEGKEPLPNGIGSQPTITTFSLDSVINPVQTQPPNQSLNTEPIKTVFKDYSLITEDVKYAHWKRYVRLNKSGAKKLTEPLKNAYEALRKEVLSNLNAKSFNPKLLLKKDSELFNIEKFKQLLLENCSDEMKSIIEEAFKQALKDLGENPTLQGFEKEIQDCLKLSTSKITESADTTKQELLDKIKKTIENNPNLTETELKDKLKEVVNNKFDTLSQSRVANIAQTSSTVANGSSQSKVYTKQGYGKLWMSTRASNVRPTHRAADGQKADSNGMFHVGNDVMAYPGGGSVAKENCYCYCVLYPYKLN